MKIKYNVLIVAFLAVFLVLGVTACGDDNSTGNDQESCNTSLPTAFAPVTVDVSYFNAQSEPEEGDPEFSTYFQVQQVAMQANATFGSSAVFTLAPSLLTYARITGVSPEFEDGSCVWTISPPPSSVDGLDLTVTVYGTPNDSSTDWEIVYDGELTDGEEVDNYQILTGSTSNDGQNGEWNYYIPEAPGSAALTYTWDIESDDTYDLSVTANQDEFPVASVSYSKGGVENTLTIETEDDTTMTYWDEDLDSGWIEAPDQERQCYTDFRNTQCS